MTTTAQILADSISPLGVRLTTFCLTYPRFVHAEFMTHRMLSRNASSSRALPSAKVIASVRASPAAPCFWGMNQSGMQADEQLPDEDPRSVVVDGEPMKLTPRQYAKVLWEAACFDMAAVAEHLNDLGRAHPDWKGLALHKQITNRVLEPWTYITVIASATEWSNFWHLRCHQDAQPEIRQLAEGMYDEFTRSVPAPVGVGEWHLPLIEPWEVDAIRALASTPEELKDTSLMLRKVAVGRCARVSYLTHDGRRDPQKDIELHDRLLAGQANGEPMHMSPFEHVARAMSTHARVGNFVGWFQYRKMFAGEEGPLAQRMQK